MAQVACWGLARTKKPHGRLLHSFHSCTSEFSLFQPMEVLCEPRRLGWQSPEAIGVGGAVGCEVVGSEVVGSEVVGEGVGARVTSWQ